ncbi:uncharacterized protein Pyn_04602 [Prunus yedoensis var. nudiflora]|uniref:Uncharacterized protein n=1 Tax=Prunus yedoensis var. nudiflora TaxID=2094558 RepID=A0A314ZN79_PRUYE|nr:uncharacterized protein Pyn_04602 [Prunus yedoensis var. nudiflora]
MGLGRTPLLPRKQRQTKLPDLLRASVFCVLVLNFSNIIMATQEELAKIGGEAFAMLDKLCGRPGKRPPFAQDQPARAGRHPAPLRNDQAVLNSKDAALLFGGIEIREYRKIRR